MPLSPQEQAELNQLEAQEKDYQAATSSVSQLESLARGAGQGLSFGLEDEARAYILSKMGDKSYEEERDDIREKNRIAQQANPLSYFGGNLVGTAATMAIPGANVAKGASMLGGVGKAAALGGLAGYGASEAQDVGGQLKDVALGAGLSGAVQGGVQALAKAAPTIGKKGLNVLTGVPEDTTERYLANPQAVNSAKTLPELAETIPGKLGEVVDDIPELSQSATSMLSGTRSADKGIKLGAVIGELDDIMSRSSDPSKLGVIARERDNLIQQSLQRAGSVDGNALADTLTEQEVKGLIKKLADQADFKNPLPSSDVAAINSASGRINALLKAQNPEYAQEVSKVAERINLKEHLIRKYGLEKKPGGGYTATDRTSAALKDLGRSGKMDRAKVAEELSAMTGGDLKEDVLNTMAKESFSKDMTRGSRNVNLGALFGHAAGKTGAGAAAGGLAAGPFGALAGGVVGATVDKYGGQIGKKVLDGTMIIQKLSSSPMGQKFIKPIQDAMTRGPEAVAATHYLLAQTEPEFRKAVNESESTGY